MSSSINEITTLLLDPAYLPYTFLTGRSAFLHLLKDNAKSIDAYDNLIDDNSTWFANENIHFYDDQPFLTSKNKIWLIPTVQVIKSSFFSFKHRKVPKTVSFHKLCLIFENTCQICYEKFDRHELTREHIFPKGKGGTQDVENISLTCLRCNQAKKDIYPFYDKNNEEIKSIPIPLPVIPSRPTKIRPEWRKYFIYKKL